MQPIGRPAAAPQAAAAAPAGRPAATATGFALPSAGAAAPQAAAAALPLAGLLAVQEQIDTPLRDRAARRHGRALLAELAALQRDMLADAVGRDRLDRLRALAEAAVPAAADAGLRDALAGAVLRARIELARFGGT